MREIREIGHLNYIQWFDLVTYMFTIQLKRLLELCDRCAKIMTERSRQVLTFPVTHSLTTWIYINAATFIKN